MNAIIIGVGALVVAALIYFANAQRLERNRKEDLLRLETERREAAQREEAGARAARIKSVVSNYRALALSGQSSNLRGMVKAGVLSLGTSAELAEACRQIEHEGLTPAIPGTYLPDLGNADLLVFFKLVKDHEHDVWNDGLVRQLARQARDQRGA